MKYLRKLVENYKNDRRAESCMLKKRLEKAKLKKAILKKCTNIVPEIQKFVAERKVIIICSDDFLEDIIIAVCHKCKLDLVNLISKKENDGYCYFYLEKDVRKFHKQLSRYENMYLEIYKFLEVVNYCIVENKLIGRYFPLINKSHEIIAGYKSYLYPEQLNIWQVDFMVTEKCSLKCSECLNLMQYYKNPEDIEIETLKRTLNIVNKNVDELKELRILGGEPFMNKQIYEIIGYAVKLKNIKNVVVFSNGTIIPEVSDLDTIAEKQKVIFYFSQYGIEKQKIEQIKKILCDIGFACFVADFSEGNWIKHSAFKANGLKKDSIDPLFVNCTGKTCPTILGDKLYICEYAANATRLKAVPYSKNDYVKLTDNANVKKEIKEYLERLEAITPCYYCHRLFNSQDNIELVEPGRQLKIPLEYERI